MSRAFCLCLSSLAVGLLISSCAGATDPGGDPEPSSSQPAYATLSSASGALRVEVRTAPEQPPGRGVSSVEYAITDSSGHPVEGLSLSVVPWMPVMGHGTSVEPTVTPRGQGRYLVTGVVLFMPGRWDLRTTLAGAVSDAVAPSFEVP